MKISSKKLLTGLGLVVLASSANAATLIYEPFNFGADGDGLNGQTTGEGLSGSWDANSTGQVQVDTPGYTYGTLATAGNRLTMDDGRGAANTGTTLTGFLDNGDTLWFSVLMNLDMVSGNGDFGFALGTATLQDRDGVPMAGKGLGFRFKNGLVATSWDGTTAARANGASASGSSVSVNTSYLVVGEMIFGAGAADADTINLYLAGTDLSLGSVVSTQTAVFDQTAFNTVTFANKGDTTGDRIDEIRFGTSSADVLVVPEPSVALLGAIGFLGLLRRRR